MKINPIKTKIFLEGDNLLSFIEYYIPKIAENSIIVITSKIVALAEKRTVSIVNNNTKTQCIKKESEYAINTGQVWLTIKDGLVMANAGIDESNADGKLILLPKNSYKSAHLLRQQLQKKYKIKNLGVLITDSRILPLRVGVLGVALGYAGFSGVYDYRGKVDIFGHKFIYSRSNIADSLATGAVLVMGEGAEQQPLAIISEAPVKFQEKVNRKELHIEIQNDMYQPLFSKLPRFRKNGH